MFFHRASRKTLNVPEGEILQWAWDSGSFPDFIEKVARWFLSTESKAVWAEKTPINCHAVGAFLKHFPDGRYVHVVRDGRDVVLSLKRRGITLRNSVERWLFDAAQILPYTGHRRCYLFPYEQLVSDPEEALKGLLSFLGEDPSQAKAMLHKAAQRASNATSDAHVQGWRQHVTDPVSDRSVNVWKTLSLRKRKRIKSLFTQLTLKPDVCDALGCEYPLTPERLLLLLQYSLQAEWNALRADWASLPSRRLLDLLSIRRHPYCEWVRAPSR
jgi:hypothetical protein